MQEWYFNNEPPVIANHNNKLKVPNKFSLLEQFRASNLHNHQPLEVFFDERLNWPSQDSRQANPLTGEDLIEQVSSLQLRGEDILNLISRLRRDRVQAGRA